MHRIHEPRDTASSAPVPASQARPPLLIPEAEPVDTMPPARVSADHAANPVGSRQDRLALETLRLLARHRVVACFTITLAAAIGGGTTLLMEPYYIAQASIFPPPSDNPLGSLGMAGIAGLAGTLGMGSSTTQFPLYERFVFSRTLIEEVLRTRLDAVGFQGTLLQHFAIPESDPAREMEAAVEGFRARLQFEADKQTAVVTLRFQDANPAIAAHVVNAIIQSLDRFDVHTTNGRARERRRFLERRLAESADSLAQAESQLEDFGQSNLRIGRSLLLTQARLQREVEFAQTVYLTLRKECELARIEEEKSVPVVNVLDLAVAPTLPAGPSLVRNAAAGGFAGMLLIVTLFATIAAEPRRLWREFIEVGPRRRS